MNYLFFKTGKVKYIQKHIHNYTVQFKTHFNKGLHIKIFKQISRENLVVYVFIPQYQSRFYISRI